MLPEFVNRKLSLIFLLSKKQALGEKQKHLLGAKQIINSFCNPKEAQARNESKRE